MKKRALSLNGSLRETTEIWDVHFSEHRLKRSVEAGGLGKPVREKANTTFVSLLNGVHSLPSVIAVDFKKSDHRYLTISSLGSFLGKEALGSRSTAKCLKVGNAGFFLVCSDDVLQGVSSRQKLRQSVAKPSSFGKLQRGAA